MKGTALEKKKAFHLELSEVVRSLGQHHLSSLKAPEEWAPDTKNVAC